MPTSDLRLLFVTAAGMGDALALRREAQLWRACAQLCETRRVARADLDAAFAEFRPDIAVICDAAALDDARVKAAGARVAACVVRLDDAWREKLRAGNVGMVWAWEQAETRGDAAVTALIDEAPDIAPLAPRSGNERTIGLLVEGRAENGELESLARFGEAVARLPDLWTVVVPSAIYYEYCRHAPNAVVVESASIADVVEASGICAVANASASANALATLAVAAGRGIVRVDAQSPESAAGAIVQTHAERTDGAHRSNVRERVAAALHIAPNADPAAVGARVARNLGLKAEVAVARYNPWLRLYVLEADISGDVRRADIGGRIEAGANGELVNAWVARLPESAEMPLRIRAIATLRGDIAPKDLRVVVSVWGWPALEIAAPEPIVEQRAGLIALNLRDAGHAVAEYWGEPGDAKIQLGRKMMTPEPPSPAVSAPAYFRAEGRYPFDRDSLTAFSESGTGQKFTNFRNLAFAALPSSARVQAMRNRHQGASAWIVGNGPSARPEDLDLLDGRITFAFNRFYLAHEQTRLRPTYTISADRQMIDDFGDEIVSRSSGDVFLAHHEPPALSGDYCWLRQVGIFPSLFSRDPSLFVSPGGSSLYVALQLGVYMGIRRFFLYGTDFQFHFDANPDSRDDFRAAAARATTSFPIIAAAEIGVRRRSKTSCRRSSPPADRGKRGRLHSQRDQGRRSGSVRSHCVRSALSKKAEERTRCALQSSARTMRSPIPEGRYHALILGYAMARAGIDVTVVTNARRCSPPISNRSRRPRALCHQPDFAMNMPDGMFDFVVVVPTGIFQPEFYKQRACLRPPGARRGSR